jgi:hypothetical protein
VAGVGQSLQIKGARDESALPPIAAELLRCICGNGAKWSSSVTEE